MLKVCHKGEMMATKTKKGRSKGPNGAGDQVVVNFDLTDPQERRALEAARLLAAKHGRRKQAIVAFLSAVYAYYEQTGELLSTQDIAGALMGQGTSARQLVGFTADAEMQGSRLSAGSAPMPNVQHVSARERRKQRQYNRSGVEVTADGGKPSAQNVANNFLRSMEGMANGFFD